MLPAKFGKIGLLGKESVSGMDCIAPRAARCAQKDICPQVAVCGPGRPNAYNPVSNFCSHAVFIRFRNRRDGLYS
jgi:hypothetical protein